MSTLPPNLPSLPSSVDPAVRRAFDALKSWFVTVSKAGGVVDVTTLTTTISSEVGALPVSDNTLPPRPTNVSASGGFSSILVSWDHPPFQNLAYTEIWRGTSNSLSSAQMVGTTSADLYTDTPANASLSITYYYWVRFVSVAAVLGPFSESVSAHTADDPAYVLEVLAGEIRESELHSTLTTRIQTIESDIDVAMANIGTITTTDFADTNTYPVGALVKYLGEIYKCILDINSTPAPLPTDTTYWTKVGQYASLADMVSATASGLTSLDTRTDAAEGTITAHSGQITALESTVNDPATGVDATATAVTGLTTRVTTAEGQISSNASSLTNLTGRVTNAEGTISSQGSAISGLTVRMTSAEGVNTSQGSAITSLDSRLTTVEGTAGGSAAAITALDTRVTDAEGIITANSSDITSLTTRVGSAETNITNESSARASADSSLASSISQLTATVNGNSAAIQTEQQVRATTTGPTWQSGVTYTAGKVVERSGSLYQCISSHYAASSNGPPNATYWKPVTASLYAQYMVKTDVNGYVSGFGLANDGATSSFQVLANKFSIGSPGYSTVTPFIVDTDQNRVVMSNALITNLTSSNIAAGTINADRINAANMLTAGWIKSGVQQVGNYIQSNNYVAGSAGWYIRSYDGYAEFQNIKARGNIEATSIKAGTVDIIDTLMVRGNAITAPAGASGNGSVPTVNIAMTVDGWLFVTATVSVVATTSDTAHFYLRCGANGVYGPLAHMSLGSGYSGTMTAHASAYVGAGTYTSCVEVTVDLPPIEWGTVGLGRYIGATAVLMQGIQR